MHKILFFITFIFCSISVFGQSEYKAPRLTKTAISNTGCFAYLPDNKIEKKFDLSYSPDSSKVYTGDFEDGEYHFAIILVKMNESLTTYQEKENMLINYLDYLKTTLEIKSSAGYGKGHTMSSSPTANGVIDYWEDKDEAKYAIKAWADENVIAVMMLYGPKEYPYFTVQQLFLDGFRFK